MSLVSLITDDYLRREGMEGPEVYGLYLMSAIGGVVMVMANDLIVLFLGLETLSIALYVLAASHRRRIESQESGIKYFVLGGFSSAFFLYGIALIYGGTGSTNFGEIVTAFNDIPTDRKDALVLVGIALLLVGLGFKVAAAPFHFWTPDVYQGAPTPVTAFMASAGKVAAFAAMLRVLVVALPNWKDDWQPVIWIIAVLTLASVRSRPSCRPTSSGCWPTRRSTTPASSCSASRPPATPAAPTGGASRRRCCTCCSTRCSSAARSRSSPRVAAPATATPTSSRSAAWPAQKPLLALALTVFLLAQAGVPLTAGFTAKFGVIQAAVDEDSYAIAVIAMVTAVIAAFLYLRIMVSVWFGEAVAAEAPD